MELASLNRWKASLIHLGISAAIGVTVVTLMLVIWYPRPYFSAMGGASLILLLIGVDVVMQAMNGGPDLANLPDLYSPYDEGRAEAAQRARPLAELIKRQPGDTATIRTFLADAGKTEDAVGYLPMKARNKDMTVIVDKKTGDVVGIVPVYPW